MDSTDLSFSLLSKVPLTWKREYRDRYHARQRMRLVRASSIIQINIDPWLFLFGFNPRCRGLCAFGRAPSQHGVTVLTVRSDGMTCSPGQIQKPRNPNFMRFLPISPGRRGRGKMALPSRVFRAIFTRSSHLLDGDLWKGFCAQRVETSILAKRYVRRVRFVRTRASLEKSCAKSLLREISYFWQVLLEIFETFSWKTLSEDVMISIDPTEGEVYFDPSLFVETKVYHCVNF